MSGIIKKFIMFVVGGLVVFSLGYTLNSHLDAQEIKNNAEMALSECGKGNVKSVTLTGFECHKL
ncbi:MAG: hypothetical protein HWE11_03665 [Gammaproteobacteria bacterium]|nr:hypothetical protein [Gammaproteobacteria bacterium]